MDRMPFLQVKGITKRFYGVKALDNVDLSIYPGEVLGVIGENGAGKSTLMKIVSGAYSFEEGEAFINEKKIEITSPMMMTELGVVMVYQDTKLIPDLKVYQNIYLHNEILQKNGLTDDKKMREESKALLKKVEIDVDVDAYAKHLTIAQKQSVEIAKALSRNIRMLILDEPTSSLTPKEVGRLFKTVNEIKKNGVAVVFISHRVSELLEICDRFAVLRDGGKVGEVDRKDASEQVLAQMMVGRDIQRKYEHVVDPTAGEVILSVRDLTSKRYYSNVSFDLHKGEILGFYGIEGNGQRELLRTICGLMDEYQGDIILHGKKLTLKTPRQAIDAGITFITNERHRENVFLPLTINKNLTVANLAQWTKLGFVNPKIQDEKIDFSIEQFNIKCYGEKQTLQELSGGNQQKVSIAGRFLQGPDVFIFDESTFGVDIGAKSEIYKFIRKLVEEGIGVIVLSSDMTEIISICDRILVVGAGEIQDEMHGNDATESRIISSAVKRHVHKEDEAEAKAKGRSKFKLAGQLVQKSEKWFASFTVIAVLIVMLVFGGQRNPTYVDPYNMGLIMWQSVPIILIAIAQTVVLLTGHIDLSIGQMMGLSTCVVSYMMAENSQIVTGLILVLAVGAVVGLLNALIVVGMGVPHFIATLSTQIVILGIALLIRKVPGGSVAPLVSEIVKYKINSNWPVAFLVMIVVVILAEIVIQRTKVGIYLRATGSFREAAFYSGINTNRVRVMAYVASGVITSLAGCVLAVRLGSGAPNAGNAMSFQSVVSVVIGGVALSGGRGTVVGAALGSILLVSLLNFLNMMQISTYWQYVCMGVMIFLSVAFYLYMDKRRAKKR